jgi:hypothetical protein
VNAACNVCTTTVWHLYVYELLIDATVSAFPAVVYT